MSKKVISVDAEAAKSKLSEAGKRVARAVAQKTASRRGMLKEKLLSGKRAAMAKLTTAGVKMTQRQLEALERAKGKYSDPQS
jgi:hypothetical protein